MPKSQNLVWLPTELLLKKFHPDNPREHSWEEGEDLEEIKKSLIGFGWLTYPTINTNSEGDYEYLISGHGRIMVADNLKQIDDSEWWELEWDKWLKDKDTTQLNLKEHKNRFKNTYWNNCPVVPVNLDQESSNAALVRLNNTAKDGQDNPAKLAAVLAKLSKKSTELTGWEESHKKVFIQSYIKTKQEEETIEDDSEDTFPSSTPDFPPTQSIEHTPELSEKSIEEEILEQTQENQNLVEQSENLEETFAKHKGSDYNYNPEQQTRFLVYLDKNVMPDFKKCVDELSILLGIPQELDSHNRRSTTLYEVVQQFRSNLQDNV